MYRFFFFLPFFLILMLFVDTSGFPPASGVCWMVSHIYYKRLKCVEPVTGIGFLGNCIGELPHRTFPQ